MPAYIVWGLLTLPYKILLLRGINAVTFSTGALAAGIVLQGVMLAQLLTTAGLESLIVFFNLKGTLILIIPMGCDAVAVWRFYYALEEGEGSSQVPSHDK